MKTILVTGGAGFIGSNFVRYLFEHHPDYKIAVLDALTYAGNPENIPEHIKTDERFQFWYGNVNNLALVNNLVATADIVIHFAAESHVARSIFDNRLFYETDVLGTQAGLPPTFSPVAPGTHSLATTHSFPEFCVSVA